MHRFLPLTIEKITSLSQSVSNIWLERRYPKNVLDFEILNFSFKHFSFLRFKHELMTFISTSIIITGYIEKTTFLPPFSPGMQLEIARQDAHLFRIIFP